MTSLEAVAGQSSAPSRAQRMRGPVAVASVVAAASAYVALVDPNEAGHYPLCPFKAATGLDCPACGGLRSMHSLLHGDVLGAIDHNALVVLVLVPLCLVLWVRWTIRSWSGRTSTARASARVAPTTLLWSVLALVAVFWVVRNVGAVPAFAWLGSST